ncbi:MAG: 30S ribosomal protein S20 [Pantoea sp. Brub]|nr:30S ribosomal protein S20 [Pantoea sp. Brub]
MANIKSSKKRALIADKRRKYNSSSRSMMRTSVKKVHTAIASGDKLSAQKEFRNMQSIVDSQANKGLIYKNKAARYKSNLFMQINKMS